MPYKWKALLTVALGSALSTLDASIITLAFPELTRVFNTDLATVMWVTVAYILVSSSLMLIFGKLSDFIGRKKIYAIGIGIFTVAMAACSLAGSVEQIIFFRVLQALGASMAIGCGTAIITEAFPGEDRGKGLGLLGVAVSFGFILGPVTGGFLLDWLDWRAIFYMGIPLGVLSFALAMLWLRKDVRREGKINLDILGTVASFCGLFSMLLGMGQIKARGMTSAVVIMLVVAGLLILSLLPLIERHAKEPIIDFTLLRNHTFTYAITGLFIFFLSMPVYTVIMPFYLLDGLGLSATSSGLLLSVIPITTMIASPISGALSDRFGPRWPSTLGAGAVASAFLCMLWFDLSTQRWIIASVLVLLGIGSGVFQPPNNSSIMGAVEQKRFGSVSALIGTSRQVALTIGMALTGSVFSTRQIAYQDLYLLKGLGKIEAFRHSIPPAFRDLILISLFLTLTVVILSFWSTKNESKHIRYLEDE